MVWCIRDITSAVMGLRREIEEGSQGFEVDNVFNKNSARIGLETCNKILYGFCGLTNIATYGPRGY